MDIPLKTWGQYMKVSCLNFKHCLILSIAALAAFPVATFAQNYAISSEAILAPIQKKDQSDFLPEDQAGVMLGMKRQINKWESDREYAELWNMESTGLYQTEIEEQDKMNYVSKNMVKYVDKRIAQERKNPNKSESIRVITKATDTVQPKSEVSLFENVKLKLQARILQGKIIAKVENPLVEAYAVQRVDGRQEVVAEKSLEKLGLKAGANYQVSEGHWIASMDKTITDEISARVSNTARTSANSRTQEEKRFELNFSYPF